MCNISLRVNGGLVFMFACEITCDGMYLHSSSEIILIVFSFFPSYEMNHLHLTATVRTGVILSKCSAL